jgi:hypothetical protein
MILHVSGAYQRMQLLLTYHLDRSRWAWDLGETVAS